MKLIECFAVAAVFLSPLASYGQTVLTDYKTVRMDDGLAEWTEFDEKEGKAIIKGEYIEIESRADDYYAASYAELPVNLSDAGFVVNADLLPASIDDKHMFGMMFDVKGNSRFQAILFNKKQYYVISCDKGEMTVDKKGLYKVQKNPKIIQFGGFQHIGEITPLVDNSKLMSVTMVYDHGTATFFLNGLEITSVKNAQIEYPAFGFFTDGKSKLKGYGFTYSLLMSDDDEEEQ